MSSSRDLDDAPSNAFYIHSLDGIRAVAVSIVFLCHSGLKDLIPGGLGVTIFFFLSGFLITTLLRRELERDARVDLRKFYIRRAIRILPNVYLYLLIALLMHRVGFFNYALNQLSVVSQFLFFANYNYIYAEYQGELPRMPIGSRLLWSLAVEEHFYLLFPFVFSFLTRRLSNGMSAFVLLGICTIVLIWRGVLIYGYEEPWFRTYLASDTRIDSILFGSVLAFWGNPVLDKPILHRTATKGAWLVASIGVLLFSLGYREPKFREVFRYTIQGLALIPIFYLAISEHRWPIFRWLNWKWIKFAGVLSYSIYLFHFTMIYTSRTILGLTDTPKPNQEWLSATSLAFLLTIGIAVAIHYAVERPLAKLRRRFR